MPFNRRNRRSGTRQPASLPVLAENIPPPVENHGWAVQNWSRNVVQFVNNGDAPFCRISYMGRTDLGDDFWGSLMGLCDNNYIDCRHVQAWTHRLLCWRIDEIQRTEQLPGRDNWTILPTSFVDVLFEGLPEVNSYGDGSNQVYPPLWEVNTVYLPISLDDENWYLFEICMDTLKVHVFYPYDCRPNTCSISSCIHRAVHQFTVQFESYFIWFLQRISYWERSGHQEIEELPVYSESVWPHNAGHIGPDSGVVICMLLRRLVQNTPLTWEEVNLQDVCLRYRRFMADELYASRTV